MTTISAGAAAGLLVALMVVATQDSRGAEIIAIKPGNTFVHPGQAKGFNPQPDPPRELGLAEQRMVSGFDPQLEPPQAIGDGSVRPAGQ